MGGEGAEKSDQWDEEDEKELEEEGEKMKKKKKGLLAYMLKFFASLGGKFFILSLVMLPLGEGFGINQPDRYQAFSFCFSFTSLAALNCSFCWRVQKKKKLEWFEFSPFILSMEILFLVNIIVCNILHICIQLMFLNIFDSKKSLNRTKSPEPTKELFPTSVV